jgi:hypothetical protein
MAGDFPVVGVLQALNICSAALRTIIFQNIE